MNIGFPGEDKTNSQNFITSVGGSATILFGVATPPGGLAGERERV